MKKMSNLWGKVVVFMMCTCMIIAVRVNDTSAATLWCDEEQAYICIKHLIEEKGGNKEAYEYFLEGNYEVFSQMIAASLFEHGIWTDKVEEIKKAGFWEDDYYPPFDEIKDNGAAHFKWDDDNGVMKTANSVIDARHWWQTAYNLMPSGYTPSTCNISKKYVPLKEYGPDAYMQQSALRELEKQYELNGEASSNAKNLNFDKTNSIWKNAGERGDDYAIFKNGKLITYDVAKYYKHPSKDTAAYKPKKTACTSIKSTDAKKLTVAWKKRTNIKGYQIQYAYNKDFKNAKTVTVANASKVSKTIGGLKSGSVVSIRIRTYEEIGRTRYYSAWDKNSGTAVKIK